MEKILAIDFAVEARRAYNNMEKPEFPGETLDPQLEFARALVAGLFYMIELHRPDRTLLLMDCNREDVWRNKVIDAYYFHRTKLYVAEIEVEGVIHPARYDEQDGWIACESHHTFYSNYENNKWVKCWVNKDEEKSATSKNLPLKDVKLIPILREISKQASPECPDFQPNLWKVLWPRYKANRNSTKWTGQLLKDEFKRASWNIAAAAHKTFEGNRFGPVNAIFAETGEADCLAFVVSELYKDAEIVFCTTDSDWSQFLKIETHTLYNNNDHAMVTMTRDEMNVMMAVKLLNGDSSDNIKGVLKLGKTAPFSKKDVLDRIHALGGPEGLFAAIGNGELAEPESFQRNLELIVLNRTIITSADVTRIDDPDETKLGLEQFMTEAHINEVRKDAQAARMQMKLPARGATEPVADVVPHDFYKNGDDDIPACLGDRNGHVVLQQCKICNQYESQLTESCPGKQ